MNFEQHWFYAGPYVPSGVLYYPDNSESTSSPSYSVWLIPGYERWIDNVAAIDVYSGPSR